MLCLSHKGKMGLVETSKNSIKINQIPSETLLLVSPFFDNSILSYILINFEYGKQW